MKQVYETVDGRIFEDKREAEQYEVVLFENWLSLTDLKVSDLYEGLLGMGDEFDIHGTPSEIVKSILVDYWREYEN